MYLSINIYVCVCVSFIVKTTGQEVATNKRAKLTVVLQLDSR